MNFVFNYLSNLQANSSLPAVTATPLNLRTIPLMPKPICKTVGLIFVSFLLAVKNIYHKFRLNQ